MSPRWVTPGDAASLAALHRSCFDHPWDARAFAGLLESPGVWGLLDGDALVLCRTAASEMEVLTLGVAPAARRGGAGRALMTAALEAARAAGVEACFLEVAHDNGPAIGLYQGLGFQQAGRRRGYYDRGPRGRADALVMRLDLRDEAA